MKGSAFLSLILAALLTAIEKKFNIKFKLADVRNLKNVGDLLDLVARMVG